MIHGIIHGRDWECRTRPTWIVATYCLRGLGRRFPTGRPAKQQLDLGHHRQDDGLVAERVPDRPEARRIVGLTVIPTLPAPLEVISGRSPDAHRHHVREHRAGGDAGSDVVETVPSGSLSLRL